MRGTREEIIKQLNVLKEMPLMPRVGDRWEINAGLSITNQLDTLPNPEAGMIFFFECSEIEQKLNEISEPHVPEIHIKIDKAVVSIVAE